jgi:hypothetical protein
MAASAHELEAVEAADEVLQLLVERAIVISKSAAFTPSYKSDPLVIAQITSALAATYVGLLRSRKV